MRLIFCLFTFIFITHQVLAQKTSDSLAISKEIQFDQNQEIQPISFDEKQIENYKKDKSFDYSREKSSESWWTAFKRWGSALWNSFWQKIFGDIKVGSWAATFVQIMKYAIIGGVIAFIIWLFIKLNPGKALLKPAKTPEVLYAEDEKIIREKDIPKLIQQAKEKGNYRLAIRYYYLLILKKLKDKKQIEYQFQKTNQEYQQEIKNAKLALQFNRITKIYDFTWYGNFEVNKIQFEEMLKEFELIQNQLKSFSDV